LVAADVLQIPALFKMSLASVNEQFDISAALTFLVEGNALRGFHQVVDKVAGDAETVLFGNVQYWVDKLGCACFVSRLRTVMCAERLHVLLDDNLECSEDTVFELLKEWTARTSDHPEDGSDKLWATCRFAFLSAPRLIDAAILEGTRGIPPRIVSLSVAFQRLLLECGEKECEEQIRKVSGIVPQGWLQCRRLYTRRQGLRKPRPGELYVTVFRSATPTVAMGTSESKKTKLREFKERICHELALHPSKVRLWDYCNRRRACRLELSLNTSLEDACDVGDDVTIPVIMLEEQMPDGTWFFSRTRQV